MKKDTARIAQASIVFGRAGETIIKPLVLRYSLGNYSLKYIS